QHRKSRDCPARSQRPCGAEASLARRQHGLHTLANRQGRCGFIELDRGLACDAKHLAVHLLARLTIKERPMNAAGFIARDITKQADHTRMASVPVEIQGAMK